MTIDQKIHSHNVMATHIPLHTTQSTPLLHIAVEWFLALSTVHSAIRLLIDSNSM